jgi:hypothetical protein
MESTRKVIKDNDDDDDADQLRPNKTKLPRKSNTPNVQNKERCITFTVVRNSYPPFGSCISFHAGEVLERTT